MNESPFLNLSLTPKSQGDKNFIDFRDEMASDNENSNLMKIDSAAQKTDKRLANIENQDFTWGMLKSGFSPNSE